MKTMFDIKAMLLLCAILLAGGMAMPPGSWNRVRWDCVRKTDARGRTVVVAELVFNDERRAVSSACLRRRKSVCCLKSSMKGISGSPMWRFESRDRQSPGETADAKSRSRRL